MQTTKFYIENYLAEFLYGAFGTEIDSKIVIKLPSDIYLCNILCALTSVRPSHLPTESHGNIEIVIPCLSDFGKKPEKYNYISANSAVLFNKKVKLYFRSRLHEFIDDAKHIQGETIKDACHIFITKYGINSIDEQSLSKNYFRWKSDIRKKKNSYTSR